MIEKKDWENALKIFNDLKKEAKDKITNAEVNIELYNHLTPFIEGKIKEFPDEKKEDDPMPEELKGAIKE